ncbi:hypothetical protein [Streptomyces sp. NPDC002889]|uniref:hypothetical protein n=1 Tax=Streptomyces sp. NPDC002889 TaxID=3364669 RepID=UPI0036A0B1C0
MSTIPSASAGEPRLVPVPIPDAVAVLIGSQMPAHVLEAEIAAESAAYSIRLCRTPATARAREYQLAELAWHNKVLAAYNPRLIVTSKAVAA